MDWKKLLLLLMEIKLSITDCLSLLVSHLHEIACLNIQAFAVSFPLLQCKILIPCIYEMANHQPQYYSHLYNFNTIFCPDVISFVNCLENSGYATYTILVYCRQLLIQKHLMKCYSVIEIHRTMSLKNEFHWGFNVIESKSIILLNTLDWI